MLALTLNQGTVYYLSALAVAIGFRMNLFNIGVDGQYRLAAFTAAVVGSAISLPKPLHILVIVVTAMLVGAMWAGIAAVLKATRGVSEVISTIMLNAIATTLIAYLLRQVKFDVAGSNNIGTKPIDESGAFPGIDLVPGSHVKVFGFIVVAVLAGIVYTVVLGRTRFGFDLRATGRSQSAAIASGVNVKRMVVDLAADLRRGRRPGRHAPAARWQHPQLQPRLPDRPGLHRHRHRPARPQQRDRHGAGRAALLVPRLVVDHPGLQRHLQGDRPDHAGHDRAVRRHRLRAGPPLRRGGRATTGEQTARRRASCDRRRG